MRLTDVSIKNPVFAWMLMFGLLLFGAISYNRMGISQMPQVEYPNVNINIDFLGAAPEVMEKDVLDPLESVLVSVDGITFMSSTARQGTASVSLEFDLDKNIDVAVNEVQSQVAKALKNLPPTILPPIVTKSNPDDRPIVWMSIRSTSMASKELMMFVKTRMQDQFTTINGVSEVTLGGYVDPALNVTLRKKDLARFQISANDVIQAIKAEHIELPAGQLSNEEQEITLRVMGEARNLEDFKKIEIKRRGGATNYQRLLLTDVASIAEGTKELRRLSRTNGLTSVSMGIRKQRGANEVTVASAVKEKLKSIQESLPQGTEVIVVYDTSPFIQESVHELIFTIGLACLLTAFVCWIFLGSWSSTFNILLAIPVSLIGTFIVIGAMGFTLNMFTLLALSLAVGIVVDDAIIVLENIIRFQEEGKNKLTAAVLGSREIVFAVLATTASLIAIFLPVAFMKGIIGKYFFEFAVTLSVAVALSSVEALTLTPMRASKYVSRAKRTSKIGRFVEFLLDRLTEIYRRLLPFFLKYRYLVITVATLLFAASLYLLKLVKKEFSPAQDESRLMVTLQGPEGTSLIKMNELVKPIEELMKKKNYIQTYLLNVGGVMGTTQSNTANLTLTLKKPKERPFDAKLNRQPTQTDIANELRSEVRSIKGLKAFVRASSSSVIGGRAGFLIEMSLKGPDWQTLMGLSDKLVKSLEQTQKFVDLKRADFEGGKELRIVPNRVKAAQLGVDVSEISQTLQVMFGGVTPALYSMAGKRFDINVQLDVQSRRNATDLEGIFVRNNRGQMLPMKEVISMEEKKASPTITRENRSRAIAISANPAPGVSQEEAIEAARSVAAKVLPPQYYVDFGGASKIFEETFANLIMVLVLGIIVAYMVLASQFNSFMDPMMVLISLPFAASGALLSLYFGGQTLNMYSMIGLILLVGLATKNSILLIELTNQLRDRGYEKDEALLEACPLRLRPILMTALATMAAAVPGAVNFGPGAETRIPMSIVVIGGMLLSTLFSLVVVPCVYKIVSRPRSQLSKEVDEAVLQAGSD